MTKKKKYIVADVLGGLFIIASILLGYAEIIAPIIIIAWLVMMFSGNG